MSSTTTYCTYESHLVCNPEKCSLLKCVKVQKAMNYTIDKLYELGVKERPRSEPQSSIAN